MPIFEKDFVAIVMDGDSFLGLITRVDLLNHLRRKADR
jgi:cystathionine beta-synthase